MDHIAERLIHIRNTITRFSSTTSVPLDVQGLRVQILLRKIALKDIQIIRLRLKPLLRNRCSGPVFVSKPASRRRQNPAKACRVRSTRLVPPQRTAG